MKPILIHKSDSTIFANVNKFLTFNLETDLDLTGWQAKFILGWVTKEVADISTHSFEIILGAEDTKQLRLGKQYGTIILTDSNGNIKTVTNTIPFEVTTAVVENEYQEIDLTIPESSGVDIKLKVGASTVTSVNGMTGDVVIEFPSLEGYVKDTDYANNVKTGVIKLSNAFGTLMVDSFGTMGASIRTLGQYNTGQSYMFISKGTLENIKDDYVKRALTQNTMELTEEDKASTKQLLGYATPTDIMQAIASIPQFNLSIVEELPLAGEKMTLYLVPKEGTNNDVYDEYIWIEQTASFEHLGTTAVDLTDYVKNTDYASATKGGVVKLNSVYGIGAAGQVISTIKATDDEVEAKSQKYRPIVPANLDFAVKTGVTTNTIELTDDEKITACNWLGTVKTLPLTEAEYEALETKDSNTLYLIEE